RLFNTGNYNTGYFNTGNTNTGYFNTGNTNTGYFNTGNTNTGLANSGNVNTGAFITGNYNNGFFWTSDYQGLIGFEYTLNIPEFPLLNFDVSIPLNIPINLNLGSISLKSFTIPEITLDVSGTLTGSATLSSITIPTITGTLPTVSANIGGPSTAIDISVRSGAGPISVHIIDIPAAPGFGNSTSGPSSGFFNTGSGSSSGLFNSGTNNSGLQNWGSSG
ncbi:hypothetical protein, partial [Mycobacterium riyadhense]